MQIQTGGLRLCGNAHDKNSWLLIINRPYRLFIFTQWPRFRLKHLLEFVRSRAELQPCY